MFRKLLFAALFISLQFAHAKTDKTNTARPTGAVVETTYGRLQGTTEHGTYCWKGIAFAKPPVGEWRYSAPQKPDSWDGIKQATEYGSASLQQKSRFTENQTKSEDCLYLNVWSPAADNQKRPVMVWIHGGGFVVGAGSSDLYNGANLAKQGDVVVVTINYRLGVLGFLYFDERDTLYRGFDNNLGIRDQIAALQWVKENIAAFGGDPNQVTIFGESAGGTSVETLLACPSAKGLFHKAIAQSGPASMLWQPETAKLLTQKFFSLLGLQETDVQKLKTISADTLKKAEDALLKYMVFETTHRVFAPTIDGSFLPNDIFQCLSPKQSGNIPLMIGTNMDEATMFARKDLRMMPNNSKDLERDFLHVVKPEQKKKIVAAYKHFPRKRGVLDLLTDAVFRIPAIRMAECQSMHSPVYMYRFQWSSMMLNITGMRTFHGLELPFVFGNTQQGRTGKLMRLIATPRTVKLLTKQMQQSWLNFARYSNPNGATDGSWKPYTAEHRSTMIFDKNAEVINDPDAQQREAWVDVKYY